MTISLHSPLDDGAVSPRHTSVHPDIRSNGRVDQPDATGSVAGRAITENAAAAGEVEVVFEERQLRNRHLLGVVAALEQVPLLAAQVPHPEPERGVLRIVPVDKQFPVGQGRAQPAAGDPVRIADLDEGFGVEVIEHRGDGRWVARLPVGDLHKFVWALGQFGVHGLRVVVLVDRLPVRAAQLGPRGLAGIGVAGNAMTSCQTRAGWGSSHMIDRSAPDRTTVRGGDAGRARR